MMIPKIQKNKKYSYLINNDVCQVLEYNEDNTYQPIGNISLKDALQHIGIIKGIALKQEFTLSMFNHRYNVKELTYNKDNTEVYVIVEYSPRTWNIQLIDKNQDIDLPWIYFFAKFKINKDGKYTLKPGKAYWDTSYYMAKEKITNLDEKLLHHIPLPNSWPDVTSNICWGSEKPKIIGADPITIAHNLFMQVMSSHFSNVYMPIFRAERDMSKSGHEMKIKVAATHEDAFSWYSKWSEHLASGHMWDIIKYTYSMKEVINGKCL